MLKAALLLFLIGLATADDLDRARSEMAAPIERFTADRATLFRTYPIEISETRRQRLREFYADWAERTAQMNFDAMSADGRIDYVLFKNHLQHEIRQLDLAEKAFQEESPLMPFVAKIVTLEESRRRMEPMDAAKTAALVSSLAKQIDETRRKVQGSTLPKKTVANHAAVELNNLRATFRHWYEFYDGYDPGFTWWMAEPFKAADTALENYTKFLREQVAGVRGAMPAPAGGRGGGRGGRGGASTPAPAPAPAAVDTGDDIIGNPIGREGLMSELANEMIPYTPEELIAIANKEFAWCEDRDEARLARDGIRRRLEEGAGARQDLLRRARQAAGADPRPRAAKRSRFVDEHDLITIPPLARETLAHGDDVAGAATGQSVFHRRRNDHRLLSDHTMTEEQKLMSMRGNNIHFSRATVFHELIPGPPLAGFHGGRVTAPTAPLFDTPFSSKAGRSTGRCCCGIWASRKTPEDRVGMLFWRMHRCARIIFSLSFHLGKMTPRECIDFLVDRVGHERDNATGEVRRSFAGDYAPLYQAAYLLGGMQILRAAQGAGGLGQDDESRVP